MSQFVLPATTCRVPLHAVGSTDGGKWRDGAPGEIRTPDLLLRRQPLYPAELRARARWIQFTCKPVVVVRTRYPELTGQGSLSGPWRCVDEPNRACRTDVVKRQPENYEPLITDHFFHYQRSRRPPPPPRPPRSRPPPPPPPTRSALGRASLTLMVRPPS